MHAVKCFKVLDVNRKRIVTAFQPLSVQYRVKIDSAFHCTKHNVELKPT